MSPVRPAAGGKRDVHGPAGAASGVAPLEGQPHDADGPVFREPWEAQAFALALALHQRGVFAWTEFAAALASAIKRAQAEGDADRGDTYYHHWLAALEALVAAKAAASSGELEQCRHAWLHAAARTPHGQPIELLAEDFAG